MEVLKHSAIMNKSSKIYIAGHRGLVGSALVRRLQSDGFNNLITRTSKDLDLKRQADVETFFQENKPEYVFLAAAKVGGILANNTYPADFIYDNLTIQSNIIHESHLNGVNKLLFLGSSCIYPKLCPQPMKEEYLLSGYLEPTNEAYAVAKIAGIQMCQAYNRQYGTNYISVMPTNLYGPGDNYDLQNSHVIPALIRKFHEGRAESRPYVEIWGTGAPKREFLYVDDLADACLFLMEHYNDGGIINIGVGEDLSIKELALLVRDIVGYKGELKFDGSKPDGTPKKLLDITKVLNAGWKAKTGLAEGIKKTCNAYMVSGSKEHRV
jgi:GDP-L-fucose synthase